VIFINRKETDFELELEETFSHVQRNCLRLISLSRTYCMWFSISWIFTWLRSANELRYLFCVIKKQQFINKWTPFRNELQPSHSFPSVSPVICSSMIGCVREWSEEDLWQLDYEISSRLLVLAWSWRRVPKLLLRPRGEEAALVAPQLGHVISHLLLMAEAHH
jgi:hypothetical protein